MRKENWPRLLEDYIVQKKDIPFEWGTNDCWQFSIHAVKEISDKDLTTLFDYQTPRKAAELMTEHGGMISAADKYFGESKSIYLAQRGDVVCLVNEFWSRKRQRKHQQEHICTETRTSARNEGCWLLG
jgi:hypothetical protein